MKPRIHTTLFLQQAGYKIWILVEVLHLAPVMSTAFFVDVTLYLCTHKQVSRGYMIDLVVCVIQRTRGLKLYGGLLLKHYQPTESLVTQCSPSYSAVAALASYSSFQLHPTEHTETLWQASLSHWRTPYQIYLLTSRRKTLGKEGVPI